MLGTLLERRGYAVQLAATIGEAITRYRNLSRPPDVVLTDARLPDGGVLDLVRELRSPPSDIPVLVVSGLDEHVDPEIASVLRMPRTSFVQKPAGVDELVRSIEALRARD
jgi:DNA-binding response OmpR family regulator